MNVPTNKIDDHRHSVDVLNEDAFIRNFGCKSAKYIPDSSTEFLCEYDNGWVYACAVYGETGWSIYVFYDTIFQEKSFNLALLVRRIRLALTDKYTLMDKLHKAELHLEALRKEYKARQDLEAAF